MVALKDLVGISNGSACTSTSYTPSHVLKAMGQAYVEQNHLEAGSLVFIEINGDELKLKPGRQRPKLAELLAATPPGLCRVEGRDEMPAVGNFYPNMKARVEQNPRRGSALRAPR